MLANKFIIVDYLHTLPIHTQTHLQPHTHRHLDKENCLRLPGLTPGSQQFINISSSSTINYPNHNKKPDKSIDNEVAHTQGGPT